MMTRRLIPLLFLCVLSGTALGATAPLFPGDLSAHSVATYGARTGTDIRAKFVAMESATGPAGNWFLPRGTYLVGSNYTVKTDYTLQFEPEAILKPAASTTLTVLGNVTAGRQQIFDVSNSNSKVSFVGNAKVSTFYPEWWGATPLPDRSAYNALSSDDKAALNANNLRALRAAIQAADDVDGGEVFCGTGFYYSPDTLDVNGSRVRIRGNGYYQTFINTTAAVNAIHFTSTTEGAIAGSFNALQDITFSGYDPADGTTKLGLNGIYVTTPDTVAGAQHFTMDRVMITGFSGDAIYLNAHNQGYANFTRVITQYNGTGLHMGTSNYGLASTFTNCNFSLNDHYGTWIEANSSGTFDTNALTFVGCFWEANGWDGLRMAGVQGISFVNPYFERNGNSATRTEAYATPGTGYRPWADIVLEKGTDSQPVYNVTFDTPRFSTNIGPGQGNPALRVLVNSDKVIGPIYFRNPFWLGGYLDFGTFATTPIVKVEGYVPASVKGNAQWLNEKAGNGLLQTGSIWMSGQQSQSLSVGRAFTPETIGSQLTLLGGSVSHGQVTGVSVTTAGTGYHIGDVLSLMAYVNSEEQLSPNGGTVTVTAVDGSGGVTAVSLTTAGVGYTVTDTPTAGGNGKGCVIHVNSVVSATDKAGGDVRIAGGNGSGTGGSNIDFYTSTPGSTGATENATSRKMRLDGKGSLALGADLAVETDAAAGTIKQGPFGYYGKIVTGQPYMSMNAYQRTDTTWASTHPTLYGSIIENLGDSVSIYSAPPNTSNATLTGRLKLDMATGNLRIGDTSTGVEKLDVGGNATVSGTITAGTALKIPSLTGNDSAGAAYIGLDSNHNVVLKSAPMLSGTELDPLSVHTVAATAPLVATPVSATTTISLPQSDATHGGWLSSTDWNTFNNKAGGYTFSSPLNLAGSAVTLSTVPVASGGTAATSASGARTNLGLAIGTDVLSPTGNGSGLTALTAANITGSGTLPNGVLSSSIPRYGDALPTFTGVLKLGSTPTTVSDAAGKILSAALNTVAVAQGGTGAVTLTSNGVLLGNGTSAVTATTAGTANQVLRVPGAGGAPAFGSLDLSQSAVVGSSILPVANGGTNASTASAARTNLGLVIGTNVLAPNGSAASLTAIPAAQVTGANALPDGVLSTNIPRYNDATPTFTGILKAGSGPTTLTDSTGKVLAAALNNISASQVIGGTFGAANGSALTSLTAANVTGSGTLPDGVLSTNVPLKNTTNAFTAAADGIALTSTPTASNTTALLRMGNPVVSGAANGTYLAINSPSGFAGRYLHFQNADGTPFMTINGSGLNFTGLATITPSASTYGVKVNRLNSGADTGTYWGYRLSNPSNADTLIMGYSSSTYTTGGSFGWLGNSQPFVYIPSGEQLTFGTGTSSTGTIAKVSSSGVQIGNSGTAIQAIYSATSSIDFAAITANTCSDSAGITVTGAADGDVVSVGVPNALQTALSSVVFTAYVSAANTVKVRACNASTVTTSDPAAATIRMQVNHF